MRGGATALHAAGIALLVAHATASVGLGQPAVPQQAPAEEDVLADSARRLQGPAFDLRTPEQVIKDLKNKVESLEASKRAIDVRMHFFFDRANHFERMAKICGVRYGQAWGGMPQANNLTWDQLSLETRRAFANGGKANVRLPPADNGCRCDQNHDKHGCHCWPNLEDRIRTSETMELPPNLRGRIVQVLCSLGPLIVCVPGSVKSLTPALSLLQPVWGPDVMGEMARLAKAGDDQTPEQYPSATEDLLLAMRLQVSRTRHALRIQAAVCLSRLSALPTCPPAGPAQAREEAVGEVRGLLQQSPGPVARGDTLAVQSGERRPQRTGPH